MSAPLTKLVAASADGTNSANAAAAATAPAVAADALRTVLRLTPPAPEVNGTDMMLLSIPGREVSRGHGNDCSNDVETSPGRSTFLKVYVNHCLWPSLRYG